MIIGLLNEEMGQAVDHLLLSEGHHIKRLVPTLCVTPENDWLNYYEEQTTYCHNSFDIMKDVDLVVVDPRYPEVYAKARYMGVPVIGTCAMAKELERDRVFAKIVAERHGLTNTTSHQVHSLREAKKLIKKHGANLVMKAGDRLTVEENLRTIVPFTKHDLLGILECIDYFADGGNVLLEERVTGSEIAFGAWFNGKEFLLPYNVNTEYKPSGNGDRGILTGECGTVIFHETDTSLKPWEILKSFEPFLASVDYRGVFDLNCILDNRGNLYLLEFTPRFGYPTLQVMAASMPGGVGDVLRRVATQVEGPLPIKTDWTVGVCAYTHGAPLTDGLFDDYEEGRFLDLLIDGLPEARKIADVRMLDGKMLAKDKGKMRACFGDRSLVVNGVGATLNEAQSNAYAAIEHIKYWGMTYRNDIGFRMEKDRHNLFEHGYISEDRFRSAWG